MKRTPSHYYTQALLWPAGYLLLIIAPLGFALIGHEHESRGFWVELGVGLGFVGMAMMVMQFLLTARIRQIASPLGTDAMLQFHRQAGFASYLFILGHAVVLLLADSDYWSFFDPRANAPRAMALSSVLVMLTLLIVLTVSKDRFRLSYEWWRLTHGFFALMVVFVGIGHVIMVGHYVSTLWQQAVWVLFCGTGIMVLLYGRILQPIQLKKQPFTLTDIRRETEEVFTVTLTPAGRHRISFVAGQFAWLTFGPTPISLQQHPFSFSSSSENQESVCFTIKQAGDFTRSLPNLPLGTTAFLEGPYGGFTLDEDPNVNATFIAGGIGITPIMSILRSLRDRKEQRRLVLIFGNRAEKNIVFADELKELEQQLDLKVVHVLEHPPEHWTGEKGLIDEELLKRHALPYAENVEYFICGPEPMMDAVETILCKWNVPIRKRNSERFQIV